MDRLSAASGLILRQKKEWGEIFTGFETKNKYAVFDTAGNELYFAAEVGGNVLLRMFLKGTRPFEVTVVDSQNNKIIAVKRPFRFYFHQASIFDPQGNCLGTLVKQFSFVRKIYSVKDATGEERYQLFGPLLHPWTFLIKQNGEEVGKITKKWSGVGKEMFTDADNFGVTFPQDWNIKQKALFMGAVFLIDFVHFENKK